jgi:hypothetical protein
MNPETLQILKQLYNDDSHQVFLFTADLQAVWQNDISGILQTEADCRNMLQTIHANQSGHYTFRYQHFSYAVEVKFVSALSCVVVLVSTTPTVVKILSDPDFSTAFQFSLAEQRQSIFGITTAIDHIYTEVEATEEMAEQAQDTIFLHLNHVMLCCCHIMKKSICHEELQKYNDPLHTELQPLDLAGTLGRFVKGCRSTLGHTIQIQAEIDTKAWILSHESRFIFCLLCMLTRILTKEAQSAEEESSTKEVQSIKIVQLKSACVDNYVEITMQTDWNFPDEEAHQRAVQTEQSKQMASVIRMFCETYQSTWEESRTDTQMISKLSIPIHVPNPTIFYLHAPHESRQHSTLITPYQVMLHDIGRYRFF